MSYRLTKRYYFLVFVLHLVLHLGMDIGHNLLKIRNLQDLGHRTENPLVLTIPKIQTLITPLFYRHLQGINILDTLKKVCYICVTFNTIHQKRILWCVEDVTGYFLHILHKLNFTYTWRA